MAVHARHAATKKFAARDHAHRERALTASAFAEEPPPQAAPNPQPASAPNWPVVTAPPTNESTPPMAEPVSTNAPTSADSAGALPDPDASQVQTVKITAANPASLPDSGVAGGASAAGSANDSGTTAPMPAAASQTVLAAPTHRDTSDVGSASWFAQVLAALGGAIAAGAVAWSLIGAGPVRTYG
jgi:hypothetical protein